MRGLTARVFLILLIAMSTAGCEIVGGIFKAGVWVGVIVAALIVVLILWVVGRARR